ncbi:MBL fold metallo-hydrolase [Actinopolymorpha sp. B17G11]|uniref:MBL fold metallo-hydrolase n=1 Tax=unclassified Actinopolymorpha TaxID=2627063 RepID=UPI0032D8BCE9
MKITVLGGCGAWPAAGLACSGYLLDHDGFLLLVDPGYATLPRLLELVPAERIDAVAVTHKHPDHCADLNPLLRARALRDDPAPALPVHTLPGALDAVLALDRPGMLDEAYDLQEFAAGEAFEVGPFGIETMLLPHYVPNAGLRIRADGATATYTGDTGPSPLVAELAAGSDVLIADASYAEEVPEDSAAYLTSARQAALQAAEAGVGRLVLTHLVPETDPDAALRAARDGFGGPIDVARPGLTLDVPRQSG